ncbi:MAG: hypothetical protein LBI10_03255 [Deltaproteobacteria bacterium]|jgi:hypothetical protein|nr:hypothetical protein [Deltaproteobacteria bacterium]
MIVNNVEIPVYAKAQFFTKQIWPYWAEFENKTRNKPINDLLNSENLKFYFTDYPLFIKANLPIFSILDLVKSSINVYRQNNINLQVYHRHNINEINKKGTYIELILKDDKSGFAIREANATPTSADDKTRFLLLCVVRPDDIHESTCDDPQIYLDNVLQDNDFIVNNNKIFTELISTLSGTWMDAG